MFSGVPLGVQLFDQAFQFDLLQAMAPVRRGDRKRIYNQFVGGIANSRPLPTAGPSRTIPACITGVVDELYRSMAALDYRFRIRDFGIVFLKINRGILILDNDEKIRQWRRRRDKEHQVAVERQQRRAATLVRKEAGNDSSVRKRYKRVPAIRGGPAVYGGGSGRLTPLVASATFSLTKGIGGIALDSVEDAQEQPVRDNETLSSRIITRSKREVERRPNSGARTLSSG